jgi:hypothetical protein
VLEERKLASMNITRNIFSDLSILASKTRSIGVT